jgi:hypothetical protein
MDRISALRNVEEALRAFEDGEADLAATEERVLGVLRTYATEFDGDDRADLAAFRTVAGPAEGTVVVAPDARTARARVRDLAGVDEGAAVEVEPIDP